MLSAPAAIPAMIEVSFGVGLAAPDFTCPVSTKLPHDSAPELDRSRLVETDGARLLRELARESRLVLAVSLNLPRIAVLCVTRNSGVVAGGRPRRAARKPRR